MSDLTTEQLHPHFRDLDRQDTLGVLTALVEDQQGAVDAVRRALPALQAAATQAVPRLEQGGRLMYVGAGTSGRLAMLDGAELPPTFSWPRTRVITLLAGGITASGATLEGNEDDADAGQRELLAFQPEERDIVIGIAASGTTPYTVAAVRTATSSGALTIGIANNPGTPLLAAARCPVLLDTGPEVISGSTRLKAGTAQKIALNAWSSAVMVSLGKVYGNLMVDVQVSNSKLEARAVRLTGMITGASPEASMQALKDSRWSVKTAVLMLRLGLSLKAAEQRLHAHAGHLRAALQEDDSS